MKFIMKLLTSMLRLIKILSSKKLIATIVFNLVVLGNVPNIRLFVE